MSDLFLLPFRPAFDLNGLLAPGARLYFYKTQTLDPQPVYSDAALTIVLPNPVSADAAGKWPSIYLDNTLVYRVTLRAKDNSIIDDVDPYLPNTIDGLTEDLEALAQQVAEDRIDAEDAADRAYGFTAAVETVTGGYWYPTMADGLADTAVGESFLIVTAGGLVQIAVNDGGSGVVRAEFLTLASNTLMTKTQIETALAYSADVQAMLNSANDAGIRSNIEAAQSGNNTDITTITQGVKLNASGAPGIDTVGWRGLPATVYSSTYQPLIEDVGKQIVISSGGVNILPNSTYGLPTGYTIVVYNNSSSSQTIAITTDTLRWAGTTLTGNRNIQPYGLVTLLKVGTNTWVASGNLT